MPGTDNNGPKVGEGGRKRNTFANLLSKNKIDFQNPGGSQALPSLSPAATANYYSQLGGLYAGYQTQLAQLKQARVGARADARDAMAAARAEKIGGLAATESAGIERGMAGSSGVSQQLAGVRGNFEAQRQAALRAKLQTFTGTRLAEQQAGVDYFMGAQSLEAQKLAEQQDLLAQQLQQNLIVSGQETQMDALKSIYQALTKSINQNADSGGGGGRKVVKNYYQSNPTSSAPQAAQEADYWLNLGFSQQAASQMAHQVREGYGPGMA